MTNFENVVYFNSNQEINNNKNNSSNQKSDPTKCKPQDFKILIVDDEPDLLEMLAFDLERIGYQVETATGGVEALSKFRNNTHDLILTDIRMPLGDGLSLLKDVKSISKETPVICITGFSDTSNSNIIDLGAYAVFEKPFNIKKMHAVLFEVLGISSN